MAGARHHHPTGGDSRHPRDHGNNPYTTPLAAGAPSRITTPSDSTTRDRYYYRACLSRLPPRQTTFLTSHPKWGRASPLVVTGGSQGGALSINYRPPLDPRVRGLAGLLPRAFSRCHRVPAQSRRRLAAHVPCRRRPPLSHTDRLNKIETPRAYYDVCQLRPVASKVRPGSTPGASTTKTCPPTLHVTRLTNVIPGPKKLLLGA